MHASIPGYSWTEQRTLVCLGKGALSGGLHLAGSDAGVQVVDHLGVAHPLQPARTQALSHSYIDVRCKVKQPHVQKHVQSQ